MVSGYTVFTTYLLVPDALSTILIEEEGNINIETLPPISLGGGNSRYIHCNYINKLVLDTTNPYIQEVVISFQNINDFKFLSDNVNDGTGYTANRIYGLIQLVNNSGFTTIDDVRPTASAWKIYQLTNQIKTHVVGNTLTPLELTNQVFKIPLNNYNTFATYNMHDYIQYPTKEVSADNELCFGDEVFFMGNVSSEIKANVYTTDISIQLNLNEFNSSTNSTWDNDDIYISEIGIYDDNKNLVAIAKLNNPIAKNHNISRTIVFDIDF